MKTTLKELASKINIELSERQLDQFMLYKDELKLWNEKINLTAITDDKDIILKHFIDSLTIIPYIDDTDNIIDIGTGAGFPGIPVKIVKPNIDITLLDSLNKRLLFLEDIITKNSLKKIQCVHGRAEDVSRETIYRESYDLATARAVANMATLSELCLPFVKVGGKFICMKGSNIDEIEEGRKAIEVMGGEIESINKMLLPNISIIGVGAHDDPGIGEERIERNIIIIRKIKHTPKEYPRKAGVASKNPII